MSAAGKRKITCLHLFIILTCFFVGIIFQPLNIFAFEPPQAGIIKMFGEEVATEAEIVPTTPFEIVEGERPADRILVDEAVIFQEEPLTVQLSFAEMDSDITSFDYFVPEESYHTLHTTPYGLYYSNQEEVHFIYPNTWNDNVAELFTDFELFKHQVSDLNNKADLAINRKVSDNHAGVYELNYGLSNQVLADAKASMMRAEYYLNQINTEDENFGKSEELFQEAQKFLHQIERRYNNAYSFEIETEIIYHENLVEEDIEIHQEMIGEALSYLPEELVRRINKIELVTEEKMTEVAGKAGFTGLANSFGEIYVVGTRYITPVTLYHEVAHLIDFNTYQQVYDTNEGFYSLSQNDDWREIHQLEWQREEDYYYNDYKESFAQAFAGYLIERYYGLKISDYYKTDTDIQDRPLSYNYFELFFEEVGWE